MNKLQILAEQLGSGKYDSKKDTQSHINRVQELSNDFISKLNLQIENHDASKLSDLEKPYFDEYTTKLKTLTYGSDEYKQSLEAIQPALKHHYSNNSHHPEHYTNGVNGMTLVDIMEMLIDWKAATERHEDGDIRKSIKINKDRFDMSDQLVEILENTIKLMNW